MDDIAIYLSAGVLSVMLAWESVSPFFTFFRARPKERIRHAIVNILLWLLNAALITCVFWRMWALTTDWTQSTGLGLLHWLPFPPVMKFCIAVLLLDLWTYWWHRMNHRVRLLWRFHRMHHSDPFMDVTTANRFHFGEITLSSILRIPVLLLLGASIRHLALYELVMFSVVQFHHANIAIPEKLDRFIRMIIVTPYMHKVHHSRFQPETDSNYSSLLSVWDRLFGSFQLKADYSSIDFGLDGFDSAQSQNFRGLLKTPFVEGG